MSSPPSTTSVPVAGNRTSSAPLIPVPTGDIRKAAPRAGAAPTIQIGKAETFRLDNGLTVILVENHKLPQVSYRVFVDYDPVMEKEAAGYIDLMGDMLSRGTTTRTKAQLDEAVDFIGASLNSDGNGMSGNSLSKHSDQLLALLSDVLLHPAFPEEEFEKVKRRTQSGLAQSKDDPASIRTRVAAILNYGTSHPYGESMTEESLKKITIEQMKDHYRTYFKPNVAYLVVVGDINRARAEQQARQYFGNWAKGTVPEHTYVLPVAPAKSQVAFVNKPGAVQSSFSVTYPVDLKPGTTEAIRARVANTILGAYFNSRVNANLREGHGWTYGASSSLQPDELVGSFGGGADVRNMVTDSAITEYIREMDRMRNEPVDDAELQVVKNVITGSFSRSLEEPGTAAQFALNTARYKLPADYYEKYLQVLQSVTPADVQAIAKKYITADRANIVVVGSQPDVADKLKAFAPNGQVKFFDPYGNPLAPPSASAVPSGMTAEKVIEDYVNAIGGKQKIGQLKDVYSKATMNAGGQTLQIQTWQKGGNKVSVEIKMGSQIVSQRVYDGKAALNSSMGVKSDIVGQELIEIQEQAAFCKEANYVSLNRKLSLKGIEDVNGKPAYVIEMTYPEGKKVTEYYEVKTALKLREMSTSTLEDGQVMNQITEYADYKPEGGVLMPHTITVTGLFPFPVTAVLSDIKVNAGVEDAVFKL